MPGFNRTGPAGQGPMTGRGLGACNNFTDDFSSAYTPGTGFGRGMRMQRGNRFNRTGAGRGWGRQSAGNNAPAFEPYSGDITQEVSMLKAQADSIKQTLDRINNQIKTLEKNSKEI